MLRIADDRRAEQANRGADQRQHRHGFVTNHHAEHQRDDRNQERGRRSLGRAHAARGRRGEHRARSRCRRRRGTTSRAPAAATSDRSATAGRPSGAVRINATPSARHTTGMAPLRCCSGRAMFSAMPYDTSAATIKPTPKALLDPPSAGSAITTAPPKPTIKPASDAALGQPMRQQAGDGRHEQRRRAVQHAGQRRRHVLLGKRKHAQRKRKPQHAERRRSCPIGPGHRLCGPKGTGTASESRSRCG